MTRDVAASVMPGHPRGGYGYVTPVPAEVLRATAKRALIRVPLAAGGTAERWVAPERLVARPAGRPPNIDAVSVARGDVSA